ncbi:unnamed protein product, partial [Porites evermanni]
KHCSKCHRLLTVCNKDKCKGKQTATRRSLVFSTKTSKQCLSHADHAHPAKEMLKATYRIVEENFIPEDRVDNKDTKSPVIITKHFQHLVADTGTTWL